MWMPASERQFSDTADLSDACVSVASCPPMFGFEVSSCGTC